MLAYTPFPLDLGAHELGLVFFGWGVLLALTSVFLAPRVQARFGTLPTMYAVRLLIALDLLAMGLGVSSRPVLIVAVIASGAYSRDKQHPDHHRRDASLARRAPGGSGAYSFIRFGGGAIAPFLAGKLVEWFTPSIPFYVGAVAIGILILISGRAYLQKA